MKRIMLIVLLVYFSSALFAQQRMRPDGMGGWVIEETGGCGGLFGAARGECIANQQNAQQQQTWQQQIIQQQQIENQRLQNELLRKKLEQEQVNNQSYQSTSQIDYAARPEFQAWQADNPWFGRDRAKTEFALLYAKQLRQERADLVGRSFFDAVAIKVEQTFNQRK